jgi:Homeodomain-like domain
MGAARIPARRGRPCGLTDAIRDRLADQVASGLTLQEAAAACGLSERTVRFWRRRAWSERPADAPFIELERRLQRALGRREERQLQPAADDWMEAASRLEQQAPERWGPVELDHEDDWRDLF